MGPCLDPRRLGQERQGRFLAQRRLCRIDAVWRFVGLYGQGYAVVINGQRIFREISVVKAIGRYPLTARPAPQVSTIFSDAVGEGFCRI